MTSGWRTVYSGAVTKLSDQRLPLWERCGGRCEVSGRPLDFDTFDMHHRRNKGMGGTSRSGVHELWNLLALHPQVHNGGPQSVHGRRQWSQDRGYLVPKHTPDHVTALWPVWLQGRRWVLLPTAPGRPYWPLPTSYDSALAVPPPVN